MQHPIYSYIVSPIIFMLINILVGQTDFYHNSDLIPDRFRATYYEYEDRFDFIVVGAGSAGALLANRLVKSSFKVLLLEAGGEQQPGQYIPSTSLLLLNKPHIDWKHVTEPQTKACLSSVDRKSGWSAGKGLGGTSLLNFMIYLRGHHKDYQAWENITGDPSWSYDGVVPHFKSFEDFHGEWESHDTHGHGGELTVQPPPYLGMAEYFIKSGEEKGIPRTDLNARFDEGISPVFYNIKNGRRVSTNTAFLDPLRHNSNLTIYKFSEVTKILFRNNNEAYGVEYVRHGVKKFAYASKEVIISAGAVNSPKLLMLSGIGPREHLESVGIKTLIDRPGVGQNLQDHVSVYLGPFLVNKPVSMLLDRDVNSEAFTDFIDHGTGPLTTCGTMATAFISTSFAKAAGEGDWPDIQYILLGTGIYSKMDVDFAKAFHVKTDVLKKYFKKDKGSDSFQIVVSGARPFQRGQILLKSTNPLDEPIIDHKYLHDDRDVEVLLEGIKRALDLVENTTSFQKIGARFTTSVFPGCEIFEFRSDDYWRCFIREYTITLHHIGGSCSMGKADSKESVVDPELRVIGTKHLRVVDASIMPLVPNSNTQASCMLIGQKASQSIIKSWKSDNTLLNVIDLNENDIR